MSRCCASSASRLVASIVSVVWRATRSCWAMFTSVVRTIWLRSCSRSRVILVRVVRPWASKKLLGLKCLMSLWSSRVSDTDSSSRPLFWMSAPTASCTDLTKVARCSCSSSRFMVAATERRPSTNLASISSRSSPALLVRLPSVCAASAIEEAVGFDAHVEFGADVDAHAILGDHRIRAAAGDLQPQRLQIDRGVEWKTGSTIEPPSRTTFWPPRPVRT